MDGKTGRIQVSCAQEFVYKSRLNAGLPLPFCIGAIHVLLGSGGLLLFLTLLSTWQDSLLTKVNALGINWVVCSHLAGQRLAGSIRHISGSSFDAVWERHLPVITVHAYLQQWH